MEKRKLKYGMIMIFFTVENQHDPSCSNLDIVEVYNIEGLHVDFLNKETKDIKLVKIWKRE